MKGKDRKFYKVDNDGISKKYKGFLLRWVEDPENNKIKTSGPYTNPDEAKEKLSSYLKMGICSWLVEYDD